MILAFKSDMMRRYEMNDMDLLYYFLRIEIKPREDGIFIYQKKYVESIFKKFKMKNYNIVAILLIVNEKLMKEDENDKANALLYRSIVGSLLYLTTTWPDIIFASSLLSRFM